MAVVRQWREMGQRKRDTDDDVEKGIEDVKEKKSDVTIIIWNFMSQVRFNGALLMARTESKLF